MLIFVRFTLPFRVGNVSFAQTMVISNVFKCNSVILIQTQTMIF